MVDTHRHTRGAFGGGGGGEDERRREAK